MEIAVLGTGGVGRTLATAWHEAGHAVRLGARTADHEAAIGWAASVGGGVRTGTFAAVVDGTDVVVNATAGTASLDVLGGCDPVHLQGRPIVDVANPLDFSGGFPPRLSVCNDDSLAEQIQRLLPGAHVVKALSTMSAEVMVAPAAVPGDHVVPICGDDDEAKAIVTQLLADLGWEPEQVWDLGPLEAARGMEMWLPLWLRLYGHLGHPMFNVAVPAAADPSPRH